MNGLTFIGELVLAGIRVARRGGLPMAAVLRQADQAGPRSLGIVLLTCGLIGLMLAYMGGAQLGRLGTQIHLADVVTVGMVRELAGLMTAVILTGRLGSAYAAELAAMRAGEEIDALRVMGVDPVEHLVLPRVLALVLLGPLLMVFGGVAGVVAGWPAATWAYGVSTPEYFHQSLRALNSTHLGIGLFKGVLYMVLVALAGCHAGLTAERSAQAVGHAATRAVVHGIVAVVAAACVTTVVFTVLGY